MARIPAKTIDEILDKASVADVLGRYVQLRRQGSRMVALCPFHAERTPSFSVDPEKGVWYCFGCQEGGSVFQFLMKVEGLSFPEAVRKLGEEVGVAVEATEEVTPEDLQRKRLLDLLERCALFFHELLLRSPLARPALEYCRDRGISDETIQKFRLGWAPEGGAALAVKLQEAGYSRQEGLEAGVLRERGGRAQDLLRARLVFPIADAQGRILAFGGRVLGDGTPKYLNTPETQLYSKRLHLYGLAQNKGAISRADRAIVVEGYLDVLGVHQAGLPLALASLGTALTEEQVRLMRRYTQNVVLAYDADRAGEAATLKAIELFEKVGLRASVAVLPGGEDPDSVARKRGRVGLEECFGQARSVVDHLIARAEARFDLTSSEGKQDFSREVLPAIGKILDPVRRDAYVVKVASKLGVTETQVAWKLNSFLSRGKLQARRQRDPFDIEERLLKLCATETRWIGPVRQRLDPECISRDDLRPLFLALFEMEGRESPVALQDILSTSDDPALAQRWAALVLEDGPETTEEDVSKLIGQIRRRALQGRLEALREEIVKATEAGTLQSDDHRFQEYRSLQQQLKGVL